MVSVVPFSPRPRPCCDNSLYGSPVGPRPPPSATIPRRSSCTLPRPPFSAHRRWPETLQPYPHCKTLPPSPSPLYHQPSRERLPSKERLCHSWFFSCAKRFVARYGERKAFRIGNLARFSRKSQQVLLVLEEEEWWTGSVQGSSRNDEAARLGLDVPESLAKGIGTQLPGAREKQARKHGLMTCSITIRCGTSPPRWHCASLGGGGWGQWYYQSVRVWQVRLVWGT